jgi:peptide-methionine (S)-S-oxide reductase
LTHDAGQAKEAASYIAQLNDAKEFGSPIVTQVEPIEDFYPAEAYHQDYYANNPDKGYCRVMIAPKLRKLGLN